MTDSNLILFHISAYQAMFIIVHVTKILTRSWQLLVVLWKLWLHNLCSCVELSSLFTRDSYAKRVLAVLPSYRWLSFPLRHTLALKTATHLHFGLPLKLQFFVTKFRATTWEASPRRRASKSGTSLGYPLQSLQKWLFCRY